VEDLIHFGLEFSISSKYKAEIVAKNCEPAKKKCRVHIEVDTGMQRTGVRCATALDLFQYLKSKECFEVVGIYSHLATADQPSDPVAERQINQFHELLGHPLLGEHRWIVHMANSNGVIHFPQAHLGMVRPGILAFGYVPPNADERWRGIAPCFSLKSKVSYFKVVEKGEGISYGHTYRTAEKTRVVTVPIGYGDGYRRGLSNKGSVLIRGKKFLISGAICMDQFMVDVGSEEVYVGDEVVLIGRQGDAEISLLEISQLCETVPHEVLCLLNDRIPRFYK
jgi:alanine racemase